MPDDFDSRQKWLSRMIELRNMVAHIPYAARHQRELAVPIYQEIEQAYQNGLLPDDLAALWEKHRQTLIDADQRALDFADSWDADFSLVKTRPE